jgi:hypothetical protein
MAVFPPELAKVEPAPIKTVEDPRLINLQDYFPSPLQTPDLTRL